MFAGLTRLQQRVLLILGLVVGLASCGQSDSKPQVVAGTPFQIRAGIQASHVQCGWVGKGQPQWVGVTLESVPHVEVSLTVKNSLGHAKQVSVTPIYFIGSTEHGNAWNQTQYHTVPPGQSKWFLNAGVPSGVKTGARISMCAPTAGHD